MPNFRRGAAAIEEAQEAAKSGGNFSPFAPLINWTQDKEERYVLFLNDIESIALVDLHEWIPDGESTRQDGTKYTNWKFFISRKDPAIGEDYDELEERLNNKPKARNVAAAVELEPVMAPGRGGRPRPKGFKVKTTEFTRKTDDGNETVTAPIVGLVRQSPINFFGYLSSFNDTEEPIEVTPFKIIRRGKDQNTQYDFTPYVDQDIDFSGLLDNLDGISYLGDDLEELLDALEAASDDQEAAAVIGNALLEVYLNELADKDEYDRVVSAIDELKGYGSTKAESNGNKSSRPARRSQRKSSDEAEAEGAEEAADEGSAKSQRLDKFAKIREAAAKRKEKQAAAASSEE